jgi:hypothetical protein
MPILTPIFCAILKLSICLLIELLVFITASNGRPLSSPTSAHIPDHLVLGTVKDNNKDRDSKGRTAKNERNGGAKLTPEQIEAIRKDSRSCREIAKDYPVHFSQIARIKSGRHWRE